MDLRIALSVTRRLWLLALLGVVATVVAAVLVWGAVSPRYEARASMLLLSPASEVTGTGGEVVTNPYSRTGPAERLAAATLLTVTTTDRWRAELAMRGGTALVEYELDPEASIIGVRTEGATPSDTMRTLEVSVQMAEEELAARQRIAGAPEETLIRADVLATSDRPIERIGSRVRATAATAALGLAATASVVFLVESLRPGWAPALRRRTRRARRSHGFVVAGSADP